MKKIYTLCLISLFFIGVFPIFVAAQDYDSLLYAQNYAPRLINTGAEWRVVLDSVSRHSPNDTATIREIATTVQLMMDAEFWRKTVPEFAAFLESGAQSPSYAANRQAILRQGPKYIPGLITLLGIDAATRIIVHSENFESEPDYYLTTSDLAMELLESISGIYFFRNFSQRHFCFSDQNDAFKLKMRAAISDWHAHTWDRTKVASICFYLDSIRTPIGNKLHTVENLAKLGDTSLTIKYLTQIFKENNLPCVSAMSVANMAAKLGADLASEDCMNKILNYRCTIDNGVECVWYLLKYPRSHIPFDVLAEVVATERYSRYRNMPYNRKFVWHYIFNEMAICKNNYAKTILLELLKIEDVLKESNIVAYYWRQKYPGEWDAGYRVCDFAFLKLIELKLVTSSINLSDSSERSAEIARILKGEQ